MAVPAVRALAVASMGVVVAATEGNVHATARARITYAALFAPKLMMEGAWISPDNEATLGERFADMLVIPASFFADVPSSVTSMSAQTSAFFPLPFQQEGKRTFFP